MSDFLRSMDQLCTGGRDEDWPEQFSAKALAAAAHQGGDVEQAPGEAPQSGGDSRNAQTLPPSGRNPE